MLNETHYTIELQVNLKIQRAISTDGNFFLVRTKAFRSRSTTYLKISKLTSDPCPPHPPGTKENRDYFAHKSRDRDF